MFLIDYTLPRSSRYILFLDMPFRYSWRHLIAYFTSRIIRKKTHLEYLASNERTGHFIIAFFEVLPILGMVVAIIERMIFAKSLAPVASYSDEHKKLARFMIKNLVPVYAKIYGKEVHMPYFLPRYELEMKALATQLEVSYKEVAFANCIFDRLALFGGSSATNKQETICSLKYDGKKKRLHYAFSSDHAAGRAHKRFDLKWLVSGGYEGVFVHHIDVPMSLTAPFMRLFVHEHFVSIGLLGLVGGLFGINKHGLLLSASSIILDSAVQDAKAMQDFESESLLMGVEHSQKVKATPIKSDYGSKDCVDLASSTVESRILVASKDGMPNQLLYRQILEEATCIQDAKKMLDKSRCSSSMQIILADSNEKICHDLNR